MQPKIFLAALVVTLWHATLGSASPRINVVDESGQWLATVRSLTLAPGRFAVPVTTFEKLGLSVSYVATEKRVYIAVPETDIMVGLRAGERRSYHPEVGYLQTVYPYPLARKRGGHFYVSVNFMQQAFPDRFSASWNKSTKLLTLKRRKKL
jgi:hypothetical protein